MKKWLICVTLIVAMLGTMVLPCSAAFADADLAEQTAPTSAGHAEAQPLFEEEAPAVHSLPAEAVNSPTPKPTATPTPKPTNTPTPKPTVTPTPTGYELPPMPFDD